MNMKKINLVKKNFYLAIVVVVLLFVAGFVIAAYDATKASHGILYTDRIETKSQTDDTIEVEAKLDVMGLLINGQPFTGGYWAETGEDIYYDGNVGIGTTSPEGKLEVKGSSGPLLKVDITTALPPILSLAEPVFEVYNGNYNRTALQIFGGGAIAQYDVSNGKMISIFNNAGSSYIMDNVGIGITTPSEKLEVGGNIKANGTICDRNGCIGGVGSVSWSDIQNIPAGFADGVDDVSGGGVSLGEWVDMTAQASGGAVQGPVATDGFVTVFGIGAHGGGSVRGYTDSSNPPTTIRTGEGAGYVDYGHGIIMPVKKGDYWRIETTGSWDSTPDVYWIPLGGGGGGASLPTCSNGQILKYNSATGQWECGSGAGGGVSFGEWQTDDSGQIGGTGAALVVDTVYQAATDGFVCAYDRQAFKQVIAILTDSSNPPVTKRKQDERGSACAPIRKNDYWEVAHNGLNKELTNVYWIPLEGGGGSGGGISCHTVSSTPDGRDVKVYCDYGERTGGGCSMPSDAGGWRRWYQDNPIEPNGWWCKNEDTDKDITAYVVCCE